MKISRTHIIVISILSLPLAYLTYLGGMNYSGYCFAEDQYLTTDEKIRIAFNHINNKRTRTGLRIREGENSVVKSFEHIPYISFEEYLKANPDCCSVGKSVFSDLAPPDFFDRITGYNSAKVVALNFKINYYDPEIRTVNNVEKTFYYLLTNCGKIRSGVSYFTKDIQK